VSYFEVLNTVSGRPVAGFSGDGGEVRAREYMAKHPLADVLFLAAYSGEQFPAVPVATSFEYDADSRDAQSGVYELVYRAEDGVEARIVSFWASGPNDARRRGDLNEAAYAKQTGTTAYRFEHAALTAADEQKEHAA
jgi:hypothetical protein